MATQPPLPGRTAANDRLIAATPYEQLTDRQKQYAALYGIKLQSPAAPIAPTAPVPSPAPDKGGWMTPSTGAGVVSLPAQAPAASAADKLAGQRDALALIKATLAQYGLPDSLADWAWSEIQAGKGNAEIMLDLRQRPEFKAEFPEIDLRQKKGLTPVSPGDIISYRKRAAELFQAAGLPQGFHDGKDDYTNFIANDISLAELGDRINLAADAAFKAPQDVRDALAQWGVGPGDMTAFWLNPDTAQPLLERKYAAAQLAGAARRTGFGQIDENTATGLTQYGVSADQAQQGFGSLASERELFSPLVGAGASEDTITQQEQIAAQFVGDTAQQRRIVRRAQQRAATFQAGGSFAEDQGGISGLGTATR